MSATQGETRTHAAVGLEFVKGTTLLLGAQRGEPEIRPSKPTSERGAQLVSGVVHSMSAPTLERDPEIARTATVLRVVNSVREGTDKLENLPIPTGKSRRKG